MIKINDIISLFLAFDGAGLITIWTLDIHKKNLLKNGFFKSKEYGSLYWPHLFAEYGTGFCLIVSAIGLYTDRPWSNSIILISLGALVYTSISSLSWSFAEKERYVYAVPMILSLFGAVISVIVVF